MEEWYKLWIGILKVSQIYKKNICEMMLLEETSDPETVLCTNMLRPIVVINVEEKAFCVFSF